MVRDLCKPVRFLHIKREFNELADYMGRLATRLGRCVGIEDLEYDLLAKFEKVPQGVYIYQMDDRD